MTATLPPQAGAGETTAPRAPKSIKVITAPSRLSPVKVGELWEFRGLIMRFVSRDITLRYRQTALGVTWVVLQPLLAAGAFAFVFGHVAKLGSQGVPIFAFTYVGMLAYTAFNGVILRATSVLTANATLVSKIFFPRLALPLSVVGSAGVDLLAGLSLYVVIALLYGIGVGTTLLLLPVWVIATFMLAVGIGFFTSALTVSYRDVAYTLPILLQLTLYLTPVAYAINDVPKSYRVFVELNPLTGLMLGMRWSLLDLHPTTMWPIWYSVGVAVAFAVFGAIFFAGQERKFADVI